MSGGAPSPAAPLTQEKKGGRGGGGLVGAGPPARRRRPQRDGRPRRHADHQRRGVLGAEGEPREDRRREEPAPVTAAPQVQDSREAERREEGDAQVGDRPGGREQDP